MRNIVDITIEPTKNPDEFRIFFSKDLPAGHIVIPNEGESITYNASYYLGEDFMRKVAATVSKKYNRTVMVNYREMSFDIEYNQFVMQNKAKTQPKPVKEKKPEIKEVKQPIVGAKAYKLTQKVVAPVQKADGKFSRYCFYSYCVLPRICTRVVYFSPIFPTHSIATELRKLGQSYKTVRMVTKHCEYDFSKRELLGNPELVEENIDKLLAEEAKIKAKKHTKTQKTL